MLLRNAWYIAAWADEIGTEPLARRICNDPVVLFRDGAGKAAALADRCCHRAAPLHQGSVVEAGIQCGYHGLVFDGSGRCVAIPGQRLIPEDARVRAYPRSRRTSWCGSGWAIRRSPTRRRSSISPITTIPARWPNKHDVYPIKGNYMLMVDNLMDLTHLGYLHAKTVGGNPGGACRCRDEDDADADRPQIHPLDAELGAAAELRQGGRVHRAASTAARNSSSSRRRASCNGPARPMPAPPPTIRERDFRFQFRLFHGLTPETETSCFYFWSAANGYRQNEPEATEQLYREIAPTFLEDKDDGRGAAGAARRIRRAAARRHRLRRQPDAHAPHGRAPDRRGATRGRSGIAGYTAALPAPVGRRRAVELPRAALEGARPCGAPPR